MDKLLLKSWDLSKGTITNAMLLVIIIIIIIMQFRVPDLTMVGYFPQGPDKLGTTCVFLPLGRLSETR